MAKCPECNANLTITPGLSQWDRFFCKACGVELEILNLSPLELEAIYDGDGDDVLEELEEDPDEFEWDDDEASSGEDEDEDEEEEEEW